jgi:membrane-bound lytic murein transglycosylase D
MSASVPRLMARVALLTVLVASAASSFAQIPVASSARSIPNEVEQSEGRVAQVIARAEDHFRKGKLNLEDNKRDQARDEFDRAVDSILESGFDVRANARLQTFYLELVERIYREEVPQQQPTAPVTTSTLVAQNQAQEPATQKPATQQVGFRDQKFEPSPLDVYSKLVLTPEEQNVSESDVLALEQASQNVNFAFTTNPLIQQYINFYQGRGRSTMESGLRRSGQYMRLARQISRKRKCQLMSRGWARSRVRGKLKLSHGHPLRVSGNSFPRLVECMGFDKMPTSTNATALNKPLVLPLVT